MGRFDKYFSAPAATTTGRFDKYFSAQPDVPGSPTIAPFKRTLSPIDPPENKNTFNRYWDALFGTSVLPVDVPEATVENDWLANKIGPWKRPAVTQETPDPILGFTTPGAIASMGLQVAGPVGNTALRTLSGLQALKGGMDIAEGNTGAGIVNVGFGAFGARPAPKPRVVPRPEPLPVINEPITDPRRMLPAGFEPPKQSIPLLPPAEPLPLYHKTVVRPASSEPWELNPNRIAFRGSTPAPPQSTGVPDVTVPSSLKPVTPQESAFNALVPERYKPQGLEVMPGQRPNGLPIVQHPNATAGRLPSETGVITTPEKAILSPKNVQFKPVKPVGPEVGNQPAVAGDKSTAMYARLLAGKLKNTAPDVPAQVVQEAAKKLSLGDRFRNWVIKKPGMNAVLRQGANPFGGVAIETELAKQGPAGKKIATLLSKVSADQNQGAAVAEQPFKLAKLSGVEQAQFFDMVESGNTQGASPKLLDLYQKYRAVDDEAVRQAIEVGIMNPETKKAWQPRANYAPHLRPRNETPEQFAAALRQKYPYISEADALKIANGATADDIRDRIMIAGNIDRATANKILSIGVKQSEQKISGQFSRDVDLPGYRKDLGAFQEHYADMYRKIAQQRNLGRLDIADPNSPISKLIEQTENPNYVRDLLSATLGRDEKNMAARNLHAVNKFAAQVSAARYLSLFRISNLGGQMNTIAQAGPKNFIKGLVEATVTNRGASQAFATKAGAQYNVSKVMLEAANESKFGRAMNKAYGIDSAENWARKVSAVAGKYQAEDLFNSLKSGKINPKNLEFLEDLTLTDRNTLAGQTKLTDKQILNAGFKMSEFSQGLAEARKVPLYWSSPYAQIPLQFKKYALQQTKAMKDAMVRNPQYIPVILGASQLIGELTGDLKAGIRGFASGGFEGAAERIKNRGENVTRVTGIEDPVMARAVDNLINSWALGLFGDMYFMSTGGAKEWAYDVLGPFVGTALTGAEGLKKAVVGNPRMLGQEALKAVPFFGPGLQEALLPTAYQQKQRP